MIGGQRCPRGRCWCPPPHSSPCHQTAMRSSPRLRVNEHIECMSLAAIDIYPGVITESVMGPRCQDGQSFKEWGDGQYLKEWGDGQYLKESIINETDMSRAMPVVAMHAPSLSPSPSSSPGAPQADAASRKPADVRCLRSKHSSPPPSPAHPNSPCTGLIPGE